MPLFRIHLTNLILYSDFGVGFVTLFNPISLSTSHVVFEELLLLFHEYFFMDFMQCYLSAKLLLLFLAPVFFHFLL